jgi:hypothetical protein
MFQFFANKPVERLIGLGSAPMTLMMMCSLSDALFAADVSTLYQVMAEQVVAKLGLAHGGILISPAFTSMAPMTAPMANRPAGCNWCGDTAVTIGQSSIR